LSKTILMFRIEKIYAALKFALMIEKCVQNSMEPEKHSMAYGRSGQVSHAAQGHRLIFCHRSWTPSGITAYHHPFAPNGARLVQATGVLFPGRGARRAPGTSR
jgi:hypothetical protein